MGVAEDPMNTAGRTVLLVEDSALEARLVERLLDHNEDKLRQQASLLDQAFDAVIVWERNGGVSFRFKGIPAAVFGTTKILEPETRSLRSPGKAKGRSLAPSPKTRCSSVEDDPVRPHCVSWKITLIFISTEIGVPFKFVGSYFQRATASNAAW